MADTFADAVVLCCMLRNTKHFIVSYHGEETSKMLAFMVHSWCLKLTVQVHHWVVLLIFSITFALSCAMFELIIFEIIGVLDARFVPVYFSFSL
jgi:hypothetical protein